MAADPLTPDARAAQVAGGQHGLLTRQQAVALGVSRRMVEHRIADGVWEVVAPGVFRIVAAPVTVWQPLAAAQLSRTSSVVFSLAAASLHRIHDSGHHRPALITPPGTSARSPVARIRRLALPEHHITVVDGIRCTSAARTVVDCAGEVGPKQFLKLLDRALHQRATTPGQVRAVLGEIGRVPAGARRVLTDALDTWDGPIRPGSAAEVRLLRVLRSWNLPDPQRQVPILDERGQLIARVDAGWADWKIGLEYDSTRWHGPLAWEHDEARHARVEALGWRLHHVGRDDLVPGELQRLRSDIEALIRSAAGDPRRIA